MIINKIERFDGNYSFLSNFYEAPLVYKGLRYLNSESAYQGQKDPSRAEEFVDLKAMQSKRLGRKVTIRDDWDSVKLDIMYEIVLAKFTQNPELLDKLKATGDAILIEGNYWHDTFWGVCEGKGKNHLGKIIMKIRAEL